MSTRTSLQIAECIEFQHEIKRHVLHVLMLMVAYAEFLRMCRAMHGHAWSGDAGFGDPETQADIMGANCSFQFLVYFIPCDSSS